MFACTRRTNGCKVASITRRQHAVGSRAAPWSGPCFFCAPVMATSAVPVAIPVHMAVAARTIVLTTTRAQLGSYGVSKLTQWGINYRMQTVAKRAVALKTTLKDKK